MVVVRRADERDGLFLKEMLLVAAEWREEVPVRSIDDIMSAPAIAHYVAGWPRPGDAGVIAEADRPVGAAWWRCFDADDPGYGFVDAAIPEVSIGVLDGWRRQGVGQALMTALIAAAQACDLGGLSLSVEADNSAVRLYGQLGFDCVGVSGSSLTMLLRLDQHVH